jgi:hypothetical protein
VIIRKRFGIIQKSPKFRLNLSQRPQQIAIRDLADALAQVRHQRPIQLQRVQKRTVRPHAKTAFQLRDFRALGRIATLPLFRERKKRKFRLAGDR